ncbi:ATP-grasp domain-containing protein [Streptomyces sp. NPDC001155]
MQRAHLLVVFDRGSAAPLEITAGLESLGDVTFAVADSTYTRPLLPLLRESARIVVLSESYQRNLADLRKLRFSAIVTFSERLLRLTARLAHDLGLPYHSSEVASLLTDKHLQRNQLRESGVENTRSHLIKSSDEWHRAVRALGFPLVLKPQRGEGSRDTYLVTDPEQGSAVVARMLSAAGATGTGEKQLVAEEFLRGRPERIWGDYVSVESAVQGTSIHHVAVTGKFPLRHPFREVGQFWPAALSEDEDRQVKELTERALRALGVSIGMTHTEIKLTPRGPRIIEVNGRLGGHISDLARRANGLDLIELAGRLALGEPVDPDTRMKTSRVIFQYSNLAPTTAFRLETVIGSSQVRSHTAVSQYTPYILPGEHVEAGVGTRWLDILHGEVNTHADLIATIDEANRDLFFEFRFEDSDRPERVSAASLSKIAGDEAGLLI